MWIILGSAVACGLALWHLRVTVPNLVEPTVEEVGDAVLAIKPTYASLTTPTRTFVVAVTAAVCGAASVCAPPWAWGVWWIWSGSVTTLVIVDYATTFLPLKLWRRCVAEAGVALLGGIVLTRPPRARWLVRAGMMTLLSSTILGAVVAVIVTLVRKHRPSPWGSAFAYGPALWAGPWMALAISLG